MAHTGHMPRNEAKPLTAAETMRQNTARLTLMGFYEGEEADVTYTKRDGSESRSRGPVAYFNGRGGMDTGSVTLDTTATKGRHTTINLHNIITINGDPV